MKKLAAWLEPERNFLAAFLGLGLLLRLALVVKTGSGGLSPDSADWMNIAWSVASGEGFGGTWRPPGYAAFLGGIFFVFGRSVIAAKLANVVLGTATLYLAYRSAARLFNERTARVTLALLSFYPYLLAYCADVLSETLLTFLIAASVLAIVRAADEPRLRNLALTGFVCGLTALTKSVILPFFLLAGLWLWRQTGKARHTLLVIVFGALTIAPWPLRNYFHFDKGYVMPVSTPWFSFYVSTCDEALLVELPEDELLRRGHTPGVLVYPKDYDYAASLPLPERDKFCREKALGWIKENKDSYAWLLWRRFLHFWSLYPVIAGKAQKAAAMATSGLYIPLAAAGVFLAAPIFGRVSLLLALFAAYTAVHLFFGVGIRYRVPIDPYFIMLAAYALTEARRRLRAGRREPAPDRRPPSPI